MRPEHGPGEVHQVVVVAVTARSQHPAQHFFRDTPIGHSRSVRLLKTLLTLFIPEPLAVSFLLFPLIDFGDFRFRCLADIGPIML